MGLFPLKFLRILLFFFFFYCYAFENESLDIQVHTVDVLAQIFLKKLDQRIFFYLVDLDQLVKGHSVDLVAARDLEGLKLDRYQAVAERLVELVEIAPVRPEDPRPDVGLCGGE